MANIKKYYLKVEVKVKIEIWEKGNYDNILIKGNVGYIIFNRVNNSLLTIESEILNEQIIKKMLDNGNPIYKSIKDMKNNAKPINIVIQPSKAEDFLM